MYMENKPAQVGGAPHLPPRCGILAWRHHCEMVFWNELWFFNVPPPFAATSFFRLLPKASTKLSVAEALDSRVWLM